MCCLWLYTRQKHILNVLFRGGLRTISWGKKRSQEAHIQSMLMNPVCWELWNWTFNKGLGRKPKETEEHVFWAIYHMPGIILLHYIMHNARQYSLITCLMPITPCHIPPEEQNSSRASAFCCCGDLSLVKQHESCGGLAFSTLASFPSLQSFVSWEPFSEGRLEALCPSSVSSIGLENPSSTYLLTLNF